MRGNGPIIILMIAARALHSLATLPPVARRCGPGERRKVSNRW